MMSRELTWLEHLQITPRIRREWYLALAKLSREGLPLYDSLKIMHHEFQRLSHPLLPLSALVLMGLRGQEPMVSNALNGVNGPNGMNGLGALKALQRFKTVTPPSLRRRRTLGSELKPHVPLSESLLIEAGDLSGRLHLGLESAAHLLETRLSLYQRVLNALYRPMGYALMIFLLMVFLSIKILPEFERTRPRAQWPIEALRLAWGCDHVFVLGWVGALGISVVLGALMWFLPQATPPMRRGLDRWVFPFHLYASFQGASFLLALSAFIEAGIGFTQAVQMVAQSSTPYMAHQCKALLHALKMGKPPSVALCELSIIHQKHHWLIVVYGLSKDTPMAYQSIAKQIYTAVDQWLEWVLGHLLGSLMLAFVGGMVCWVYWAMFEIVETPSWGSNGASALGF